MHLDLPDLLNDIADAIVGIDASAVPFKAFQPGVGPYGEPQLVRAIADHLNRIPAYAGQAVTKRTPDLRLGDNWALEIKIARPYGDNGREAENWSVNLLHPYPGNVSLIGDALKLSTLVFPGRRAVVVIGYEHAPPRIGLAPLLAAFEAVAREVTKINLGPRVQVYRSNLRHPVHQAAVIAGWEVYESRARESVTYGT